MVQIIRLKFLLKKGIFAFAQKIKLQSTIFVLEDILINVCPDHLPWLKPSRGLSTMQPLTHSPLVGWGRESEK